MQNLVCYISRLLQSGFVTRTNVGLHKLNNFLMKPFVLPRTTSCELPEQIAPKATLAKLGRAPKTTEEVNKTYEVCPFFGDTAIIGDAIPLR